MESVDNTEINDELLLDGSLNDETEEITSKFYDLEQRSNLPSAVKLAIKVLLSSWEDVRVGSKVKADSAMIFFMDGTYKYWLEFYNQVADDHLDGRYLVTRAILLYRRRGFKKRKNSKKSDKVIDFVQASPQLIKMRVSR